MPGVEDWVNKPQEIIECIFEQSGGVECHKKVVEYFEQKIQQKDAFKLVPSINDVPLQLLQSDMLVRFRCMIQDMYDPEYFLGHYEVVDMHTREKKVKCGLYKDLTYCKSTEEVDLESPRNVTLDRLSYYCVSVPGENQWVKKKNNIPPVTNIPIQYYLECIFKENKSPFLAAPCSSTSTAPIRSKRPLDEDCIPSSEDVEMELETTENGSRESKRSKSYSNGCTVAGNSNGEQFPEMNFPLPDTNGKACIVKMYGDSSDLKVNEVIEFIGVLSMDPSLTHLGNSERENEPELMSTLEQVDALDAEELRAHNPPVSLVPRLHAILVQKYDHNNPNLPLNFKFQQNDSEICEMSESSVICNELVALLTEILLGDSLAAQYFLCHLISSVYMRRDITAVGKFCLNLINVPKSSCYPQKLYDFMSLLVTKSYFLPLTLQNLNMLSFVPSKNYTTNRLMSGVLQLSSHTHLILDETALIPGQLNEKGVRNVKALDTLINWQKVEYDFNFHKIDYPADVAVLILSEGKSLLPSDFALALCPTISNEEIQSKFQAIDSYLTEPLLCKIRNYLTLVKVSEYDLTSDIQKIIQEDFVMMRKNSQDITAEDLHSLLALARLLSLSKGEKILSNQTWNKAKALETERKYRLHQRSNH